MEAATALLLKRSLPWQAVALVFVATLALPLNLSAGVVAFVLSWWLLS